MKLTKDNRREYFEACEKLGINKNCNIVSNPDQQRILLSDCKIDRENNIIVFGGTREDGTVCLVKIKLEENQPVSYYIDDFCNALITLAAYCSPIEKMELDERYPEANVKLD